MIDFARKAIHFCQGKSRDDLEKDEVLQQDLNSLIEQLERLGAPGESDASTPPS